METEKLEVGVTYVPNPKPDIPQPVLRWDDQELRDKIANTAKESGEKMEAIKANRAPE